jgi:hypothetical protein
MVMAAPPDDGLREKIESLLTDLAELDGAYDAEGRGVARERTRQLLVTARTYAQMEAKSSATLVGLANGPEAETRLQRVQRLAEAEYQGAIRQLLVQQVRWLHAQLRDCDDRDPLAGLCMLSVVVIDVDVDEDFGPPQAPLGTSPIALLRGYGVTD